MPVSIECNPYSIALSKLTEQYCEGEPRYFVHSVPNDEGFVIYPTVLCLAMLSVISQLWKALPDIT